CHDCGVLHRIEPTCRVAFDDALEESEDFASFAAAHATHYTARLVRQGDETVCDRPLWDPMGALTFQATDGEQHYIVRARRRSIEEPRTYRFAPGELEPRNSQAVVDDGDL